MVEAGMVAVGKGYHKLPFILGYLFMGGKNRETEKCNTKKECVCVCVWMTEPALTETSIHWMMQVHVSMVEATAQCAQE